jgi:membrane-associated phospholipid phosphatase
MALVTVRPTKLDIAIANAIATHTSPALEEAAGTLTWAADEKLILALAAAGWLYVQVEKPSRRPMANHVLAVSIVSSLLPHLLKRIFDQRRPDRRTIAGHWRGIPFSGKPMDAFPSGHALHMGALASLAELLPKTQRRFALGIALGLSATRIVLLAHWVSDVATGFALGAVTERLLRFLTLHGRGNIRSNETDD